jgi:hypothetical protein
MVYIACKTKCEHNCNTCGMGLQKYPRYYGQRARITSAGTLIMRNNEDGCAHGQLTT